MKDAEKIITRLVLKAVEPMSAADRALHYRALACVSSDDALVAVLAELAAQLEAVARKHVQLLLDIDQPTPPKN